jgi:hypothetical protein
MVGYGCEGDMNVNAEAEALKSLSIVLKRPYVLPYYAPVRAKPAKTLPMLRCQLVEIFDL